MAETFDCLVIGSGPAGIAAARSLSKSNASFLILEARNRVGGRTFTSDSLGANRQLDHGARWIHGSCAKNSMVKLVAEMKFDSPEDAGIEYQLNLPKSTETGEDNNTGTAPPFELSDSGDDEEEESGLILKVKGNDTKSLPTKNLTRVVTIVGDTSSAAKESSNKARTVARKIFGDIVKSVMNNLAMKLKQSKYDTADDEELEKASLMDVLLWLHLGRGAKEAMTEEEKREKFDTLCREQLVMKHEQVDKAVKLIEIDNERTAFREEVMALFNLQIYTILECWEGAPIHLFSAKSGMESTCLPGGNMILPFGYGGLVKRLAQPLIDKSQIRLQHEVVSIVTNETENNEVVVQCRVTNEDGSESLQEFHASACIVAIPLGVLRSGGLTFEPKLPPPLGNAIQNLGIAVRNKIELLFDKCWWPPNVGRFTLACTHLQQSPTYHPYSTFIVESTSHLSATSTCPNILVCYVAGEFAKETESKSDTLIQQECMRVLRQSQLAVDTIPDPIAIYVTRWLQDPHSRGSWTFYAKGSSPEDIRQFRENSECQRRHLYFAGEHTCHGLTVPGDDLGCVHGAWVSGEIAAEGALKCLGKVSD